MATIDDVLNEVSVTRQQALNWMISNVNQPKNIFQVSFELGITTTMLSDLTGVSAEEINHYFTANGMNTDLLAVGILFNSDLGLLSHLVELNNHTGALSTATLIEAVKSAFNDNLTDYNAFFDPVFNYQKNDGIYSPDELGVPHLDNIPSDNENIESIFYGTLINQFQQFDASEYQQILESPANQAFLFEALSDSPATPFWSDAELAEQVISYSIDLINEYWNDISFVGILDHSYLGQIDI